MESTHVMRQCAVLGSHGDYEIVGSFRGSEVSLIFPDFSLSSKTCSLTASFYVATHLLSYADCWDTSGRASHLEAAVELNGSLSHFARKSYLNKPTCKTFTHRNKSNTFGQ